MDAGDITSTNKLLQVIVALLLRRENEKTLTIRQQVETLYDLGVKPIVIAEILGKTSSYVNKELSSIRKNRNKEK
jgi:transposase-like protein